MKRLRSSEDLDSYGEKGGAKDWGRREEDSGFPRSSSSSLHRNSYYKTSESGRKVLSSSTSRYDRLEDERESTRTVRKRSDYDLENYDRRKPYDRHREGNERGILSSSPRGGYGMDRMHRSESFSGPRRDFPKGFRSERDRSRREGTATSWRRFGSGKDGDDGSRSSGSEIGKGSRPGSEDVGRPKSPQGPRDVKSPAWSKDSGSEQSKSVEVKKSEDVPVESVGRSSDREEGELEPDPQPSKPLSEPESKDEAAVKSKSSEFNGEFQVGNKIKDKSKKGDSSKEGSSEEQVQGGVRKDDHDDDTGKTKELTDSQDSYVQKTGGREDENEATGENEGSSEIGVQREGSFEEDAAGAFATKTSSLKENRDEKDIDLEMNVDCPDMIGSVGISNGSEIPLIDENAHSVKDKGKSVAVFPSSSFYNAETNMKVENGPKDLASSGDVEMEGPSVRGFQFFSADPVKKQEKIEQTSHSKANDDKLALDLSLSLPNVLLPIGAQNRPQAPGSPSRARSFQSFSSFHTNSDGFTASMSFSGSQQFTHNPSCSLTHNTLDRDFEQSVKSKPLFQGVDWKAIAADENKIKETAAYQAMQSRGNGLHLQSQVSQGNSIAQAASQNPRVVGGSSKISLGIDRQLSFNKNLAGSQGAGSYDNGSEYSKDRRLAIKEKDGGGSQRFNELEGKEKALALGPDFAESIITMIVSEPLHRMARRFNEMPAQHMACVKEFVLDVITNPGKQWQLSALQKVLRKRSDITQDALINSHRTQLEILVALKTGLHAYLLQKHEIPMDNLAEVFLNLRCRNLSCGSLLPVDECDCKICAQRNGFCRECMCLVCSKFDMASNTCSWVGCDLCLHWCHADCGLRESHIRNGRSATGAQGTTEMQFHCVACDHPSEMFGFVKEVFQNFLKEWTAENLSRELEYVRKIFCASEDVRGKQLHETAIKILSKLSNRADLQEVQNHIMSFFTEADLLKPGNFAGEPRKEMPTKNKEIAAGTPLSSQGAGWLKSIYPEKTTHLENSVNLLPGFDSSRNDKYAINMDLRPNAPKEPVFDELESIVRIKHAEAKMFQSRADDARKEAEALKRISVTKLDRIEEEYTTRITKLRLTEAEDMRKQKVEELQALERAYQEYFHMKMRMETDIKDLLLKMEATRRNLAA